MTTALIIDDEEDIRVIATLALSEVGGFEVIVASGCAEGVQVAQSERPDVILLDVMMPDGSGLEVLDRLRTIATLQTTPVVFMTAKVQRHELDELQATDAKGVIAKPFDPLTLAEELTRLTGVRS